tara:strand:+ start:139 stop:765 length:627 start_codon:yes stop_codon:yes gene_type:complete
MKSLVIPAIISSNQKELNDRIEKITGCAKRLQLDVMDGKFVKNKSLQFKFKLPQTHTYEAHLMVTKPNVWVKRNLKLVQSVVIHIESIKKPQKIIEYIKSKNKKVGLAINPYTSIKKIEPYLELVDKILVMTVKPGKYGAKFEPKTLTKIKQLRKVDPKIIIQADGGITPKTILKLKQAGVSEFVVGSYLQQSINTKLALKQLKGKLD